MAASRLSKLAKYVANEWCGKMSEPSSGATADPDEVEAASRREFVENDESGVGERRCERYGRGANSMRSRMYTDAAITPVASGLLVDRRD